MCVCHRVLGVQCIKLQRFEYFNRRHQNISKYSGRRCIRSAPRHSRDRWCLRALCLLFLAIACHHGLNQTAYTTSTEISSMGMCVVCMYVCIYIHIQRSSFRQKSQATALRTPHSPLLQPLPLVQHPRRQLPRLPRVNLPLHVSFGWSAGTNTRQSGCRAWSMQALWRQHKNSMKCSMILGCTPRDFMTKMSQSSTPLAALIPSIFMDRRWRTGQKTRCVPPQCAQRARKPQPLRQQ